MSCGWFRNISKLKYPKMKSCIKKVKLKGKNVNPIAVCRSSVLGK